MKQTQSTLGDALGHTLERSGRPASHATRTDPAAPDRVGDEAWLSGLPVEQIVRWVEASCASQGLAPRIADTAVIRRVVALVGVADPAGGVGRRTGRSQSPDGRHTVGVESPRAERSRCDDSVVEYRGDDGVLFVEVQRPPLSA